MEFTERISVVVKPNARKNVILKKGNPLHVAIAAPPENGKANKELERFLSKLSGKKAVVKSGFTSKRKTVLLS
ncbi:DUF167 domain-containing protein [Candidatus Woesearchaeota archaeon]|nr:DUF167 domain-containing protein [Candidatus Woesearchaeota archaeon]